MQGEISKDKMRSSMLIRKDLRDWLAAEAKSQDRSLNWLMNDILKTYAEQRGYIKTN